MLAHTCPHCRIRYSLTQRVGACPQCGEFLQFEYGDDHRLAKLVDERFADIRRYHRLLPLRSPDHPSLCGVGGTPLVRLNVPGAEEIELFGKIETASPVGTGTFKDREAGVVMSRSRELGRMRVCLQSTGNTAIAAALAAQKEGVHVTAFVPSSARRKLYMPHAKASTSEIVEVIGTPQDLKDAASRCAADTGAERIAPWSERCICNATIAYELVEQTCPPFDYYVQTVAAGMGPIGVWHGMKWLLRTGQVRRVPRILAVQISEFDPLYQGWVAGLDSIESLDRYVNCPRSPFETTLFTTNSVQYYPSFSTAIRESGGQVLRVTPAEVEWSTDQFVRALSEVGHRINYSIEKSAAIAWAGLLKALRAGTIPSGSRVVLLVTGKGAHLTNVVRPDRTITVPRVLGSEGVIADGALWAA